MIDRKWTFTAALVVLLFTTAIAQPIAPAVPASAAGPQEDIFGALTHDGLERSYLLHLPPDYDPSGEAVPLIVALHGRSSSGLTMSLLTDLNAAADAAGHMVVYPDTHGYNWGEDTTIPLEEQIDDVGFIAALLDELAAAYNIDPAHVNVTGFHNGGLMAYRLACELPDRFESVAVVGPLMWDYQVASCPAEASAPVNMLIMHGSEDLLYWEETREMDIAFVEGDYTLLGVQDTLDFWIERNGCDPAVVGSVNEAMNARAYTACQNDTQVAYYSVLGGRENWPRLGDYKLNQFGLDASTMIMQFFAGEDTWAHTQQPYGQEARTYVVYVPSTYDAAEPTPVVMVLHGRYGSGEGTAEWTDMNRIAEENGFIAVYPDGLLNYKTTVWYDTGWNYMRGVPDIPPGMEEPNDAAFLADLLDDLALDLNIDPARVYVTGISNGGFMVHHLACADPTRYAAYADVIGSAYYRMEDMCQQEVPTPMLIMHGTDDDNVLWKGITAEDNGQEFYLTYPISGVFEFWGWHNGCDVSDIAVEDLPQKGESPNSSVRILSFNCPEHAETVLYGIIGGGHKWPGTAKNPEEAIAEKINMDIDAGEVIWEFFSRHSR